MPTADLKSKGYKLFIVLVGAVGLCSVLLYTFGSDVFRQSEPVENVVDTTVSEGHVIDEESEPPIEHEELSNEAGAISSTVPENGLGMTSDNHEEGSLGALLAQKGWYSTLNAATDLFEIDLSARVTSMQDKFDNHALRQVTVIKTGDRKVLRETELHFDAESGSLIYFLGNMEFLDHQGIPDSDLVSEELALKRALSLKETLRLEGDTTSPRIHKGSSEWNIRFDRYYKGYRCQGRSIKMCIALNGAKILLFQDRPAIYPSTLTETVSEQMAIQIALPFLVEVTGKSQEAISLRNVEQTISLTGEPWSHMGGGGHGNLNGKAPVPRLVWDIAYETTEHDAFRVLIDSSDGNIYMPYLGMD